MNLSTASAAASVMGAASKASNFASQTVETARTEVLKEPLGFIKIIQLLIAIITFAVAVNGGDKISFGVQCSPGGTLIPSTASYSYPYDLSSAKWGPYATYCMGINETQITITSMSTTSIVASAGFFVFTGVMSFLYSITFIVVYVFFRQKYDNNVFFPLVDLACTVLMTVFWFAGSIAWSKSVNDIKTFTDAENYLSAVDTCQSATCIAQTPYPTYASLIVSCIFGFSNLLIWSGDCWFVLKETSWFKNKYQVNNNNQRNNTQQQNPQMYASSSNNKI